MIVSLPYKSGADHNSIFCLISCILLTTLNLTKWWVYSFISQDCFLFLFFNRPNSLYFSGIKLCGGHSWNLGPLQETLGLYKIVSEFLIGRLGEQVSFQSSRMRLL